MRRENKTKGEKGRQEAMKWRERREGKGEGQRKVQ